MLAHQETQTNSEFLRELTPGDPEAAQITDINSIANTLIDWLFTFGLFIAVASLIILAVRIMFARATGDVAGAKTSSNGIFWVLGGVILILIAPQLVLAVWEAFGGA